MTTQIYQLVSKDQQLYTVTCLQSWVSENGPRISSSMNANLELFTVESFYLNS